jgi:hypothetical protein
MIQDARAKHAAGPAGFYGKYGQGIRKVRTAYTESMDRVYGKYGELS